MDEEETKPCPNCKREIPAVNFTIHSVHCARNIRICPVCKEPVPSAELDDHHQKLHKLLPCKQCGESVCGTDLEDHIRDSCANTVKSCRFCELELPRRELPTHEGYCGVRTEQCPDCKEYVMIKYQQLHLDSNHGFLRLDDDPVPPKKEPPKNFRPSKSNLNRPNTSINGPKVYNTAQRPTSVFDEFRLPRPSDNTSPNNNLNRPNELSPSTFGNPRPKPLNSLGSAESRPSSSNSTPSSSNPRPSSSNPRPSSSNPRPSSSNTVPDSYNGVVTSISDSSPNSIVNPRPGTSNDRLGSTFATPIPISSILSSPNRQASANINHGSSNTNHGSSNSNHGLSNINHGSSNTNHGSSNTNHGSSNTNHGSSNTNHGSVNANQSSSICNNRPSNFDIAGQNRTNNKIKPVKNGPSYGVATSSNIGQDTPSVKNVKKRTNDQPQINMDTSATKTVDKDLGVSRGAVKKRPAPPPPQPPRGPRDLPFYSALRRQQQEERGRREQNEYNLAHGLPPVLNPAQKIEKLRKLDALQNRDYEEEYRSRQRRPSPEPGYLPHEGYTLGYPDMDEATRQEFKNLKPMSPTQFMRRFSSLQVAPAPAPPARGPPAPAAPAPPGAYRFPEIRSSLRELRRGLNEVTAPYNTNNMATNNNNGRLRPPSPPGPPGPLGPPEGEVRLPCEFCARLLPAQHLVQHQTGCRPDLAQLMAEGAAGPPSPPAAPSPPSPPCPPSPGEPVIPCEFCMRSLPVYLIIEHQERCIRENMPV